MKFVHPSGSQPLPGYTIKRGIGRGGFGEVYYALSDAGKEVALKLIQRNLDVELRGVTQCLNLNSPHLIRVYDIRESEVGDTWIVMEYVPGETLEQVIRRHPQGLPEQEALDWLRSMCQGVKHLHDRGIVHRDLKPGNVFRDEHLVKIGDYGLSKFISASRRSGHTESIGTVHYMAPEVASGKYGRELDIYALGIMFYEMLTGQVPFDGESAAEILMKHLSGQPDLNLVPANYRPIIAKCLAKDPASRFPTVEALLSVLPEQAGQSKIKVHKQPPPLPNPPQQQKVHHQAAYHTQQRHREPIAAFVGDTWRNISSDPLVGTICIIALVASFVMAPWLWILAGWVYAIYYVALKVVQSMIGPASYHPPQHPTAPPVKQAVAVAPAHRQTHPHQRPQHHQGKCSRDLRAMGVRLPPKTRMQWADEWLGSLVRAAGLVLLGSGAVAGWNYFQGTPIQEIWSQFTVLSLVGLAGSWGLLSTGKLWEKDDRNYVYRRVMQGFLGVMVGLTAFSADYFLTPQTDAVFATLPTWEHVEQGELLKANTWEPLLMANKELIGSMAFFGALFFLVRWWHQTDPLRSRKFGFWTMLWCGLIGFVLNLLWMPYSPLGFIWATMISLAVQFAAPHQADTAHRWAKKQFEQPNTV